MGNSIGSAAKESIRLRLLNGESIREISKKTGISRNAIRRICRNEGLSVWQPSTETTPLKESNINRLNLHLLEKMYSGVREPGPARDFESEIKSLALEIGQELNVNSRVDSTRLELAISQYILYRRFFFASMDVSDKHYCGPYAKFHDKQAKAAVAWIEASNHALEAFSRLIRELEVKAGLRGPYMKKSGVTLQQQVNVMINRKSQIST